MAAAIVKLVNRSTLGPVMGQHFLAFSSAVKVQYDLFCSYLPLFFVYYLLLASSLDSAASQLAGS